MYTQVKYIIISIFLCLWTQAYAVISQKDADLYHEIFTMQKHGNWKKADTLIRQLENKILMGHVLYQRYMHPTKYKSSYKELHLWMKSYADYPLASKIYKLALKRRPDSGWKPLPTPIYAFVPKSLKRTGHPEDRLTYTIKKSNVYSTNMRRMLGTIKNSVNRGRVTKAYEYLNKNRAQLSRKAHAEALSTITRGYYKYHKTSKVFKIADEAYKMHPETSMYASWWAGLEAFRQKQYQTAITHFLRVGKSASTQQSSMISGAYFWAGRSAQMLGDTQNAKTYWKSATMVPTPYKTEFYVLLSYQALGEKPQFDFSTSGLDRKTEDALLTIPALQRAYALSLSKAHTQAEQEFRQIQPYITKSYQKSLMQFAYTLDLPYIQRYISRLLINDQQDAYAGYAYPSIPYKGIKPAQTNPELVLGFMRQESNFKSFAVSHVGARGLMQVMPATARFIDNTSKLGIFKSGYSKYSLTEPEVSMTLGDAYLAYLLKLYDNNLILTVASYNAGPGNIKKWRGKTQYNNDPLLLIESIPNGENRQFLENVLANYWMYRLKHNLPTPTLTDIAQGSWAYYVSNKDMRAKIKTLQSKPRIHPKPSQNNIQIIR